MNNRMIKLTLLVACVFYLTACGQSGRLYLPPQDTAPHASETTH
jgi:predicted small lipoprotein YifL